MLCRSALNRPRAAGNRDHPWNNAWRAHHLANSGIKGLELHNGLEEGFEVAAAAGFYRDGVSKRAEGQRKTIIIARGSEIMHALMLTGDAVLRGDKRTGRRQTDANAAGL